MYIQKTKYEFTRQSAILHVSGLAYCEVNLCAIFDHSEENDNLDLFLAFWNRSVVILSPQGIFNHEFLSKKFWPISKKGKRRIGRRNNSGILSSTSTISFFIGYREISIASELQDFLICSTSKTHMLRFLIIYNVEKKLERHIFANVIEARTKVNDILVKILFDEFILIFDE
jgi:hypothetical protein